MSRLRGQCRAAKERLSTSAATSLAAEMPGHRGDVRITRNELDDAIRQPLTEFAGVLQQTLDRNGARSGDLVAVASAGGGARIPFITTTLSEHFGVPVVTTPQPELTSAIGGGLQAARGAVDEGATAMAEAAPPTAAAAAALDATQMAPEVGPGEFGAGTSAGLAWSEADDIPDVAPTDPYDYYAGSASTDAMGDPRPQMQFAEPETDQYEARGATPGGLLVAGVVLVLAAISAAVWFVLRNNESTPSPSSTTVTTTATTPAPTSAAPPPPPETPAPEAPPPQETQTITRAPETITQTQAPPPPPASEAPPPPPPTSEAPPPPPPEAPSSPSTPPPLIPTLPYPTIPGLPFVPAPDTAAGSCALGCVHD